MLEVLWDAALDTLKIFPLLLIIHILIEVLEHNSSGKKLNRMLGGKLAPLIGSSVGILPQCGFSVVAADLYGKKRIALGTMLAVFIATSDEAIPILLSTPGGAQKLLPLLLSKFVFAVAVGYVINFIFRNKIEILPFPSGSSAQNADVTHCSHGCCNNKTDCRNAITDVNKMKTDCENSVIDTNKTKTDCEKSVSYSNKTKTDCEKSVIDTNKTKTDKKEMCKIYLLYPLVHALKVLAFIFAVNLILGYLIYFIKEETLADFLHAARWFQPMLSGLVGLIPNCASSVIITQLYASGALTFGGAFAGLTVNAGLGLIVLWRQNKNVKQNLLITVALYSMGVLSGLLLTLLPF